MKKILLATAVTSAMLLPSLAAADLSATAGIVSDYTFNGVSQTDNSPALQVSLDYGTDDFYVGTWASNVDFDGDQDTNIEWDFYVGKYFQVSQTFSVDTGIAYYTYHGQDNEAGPGTASDDFAYPEVYGKFGLASDYGQTELNLWYTWDYFGYGEGHSVAMLAHSYEVVEGHTLRASVDQSMFSDSDVKNWGGESSYNHYRLGYETSVEGFDLSLAVETTDIDEDNDPNDVATTRIVAGVSHTYAF
jgi:uncharacterized protein (TIGR02001 family)